MKVLIYSAKDFEIPFLEKANNNAHSIKYITERLTSKTAMMALGFDAISIFSADDASSLVLEKLKDFGVDYITLRSAGYDNVNLQKANKLGIRVAHASGYLPYAIAEHAIALILGLNRKLVLANRQVNANNFSLSNLVGFDLHNKTVGIIGTGRIGKVVVKIMNGFGCRILANDIVKDDDLSQKYKMEYRSKETLCKQSDIIILCTPLNTQTHHLIDATYIQYMKKNVMLINIARGAIVNTEDVLKALETKKIGSYGTDVYEYESGIFFYDHSKDIPDDKLLQKLIHMMPNVLITPHQAFATKEALTNIAETTIDSINCWEKDIPVKSEIGVMNFIHSN